MRDPVPALAALAVGAAVLSLAWTAALTRRTSREPPAAVFDRRFAYLECVLDLSWRCEDDLDHREAQMHELARDWARLTPAERADRKERYASLLLRWSNPLEPAD